MNDRNRLIELIDGFVFGTQIAVNSVEWDSTKVKELADYLLANGVIVPPCKVGNYIYYPWHYDDNSGVAILEVDKIVIKGETLVFILDPESDMPMPCWFSMDDFGKTVFLTKPQAEEALKNEQEKL